MTTFFRRDDGRQSNVREVGLRVILVALLLAAYFFGWRPARNSLMESVVHPILSAASTKVGGPQSRAIEVDLRAGGITVRIPQRSSSVLPAALPTPAGTKFLLPAIVALLMAPRKPYWLILWTGHVLLLAVSVVVLALALSHLDPSADPSDIPIAFYVADFLQGYVLDVFSLAIPVLAFAREGYLLDAVTSRSAAARPRK